MIHNAELALVSLALDALDDDHGVNEKTWRKWFAILSACGYAGLFAAIDSMESDLEPKELRFFMDPADIADSRRTLSVLLNLRPKDAIWDYLHS